MVFYHSMNAGSVAGIPESGGDTHTIPYVEKLTHKSHHCETVTSFNIP